MDGAESDGAATRPVATLQIRWFIKDDGTVHRAVDLDAIATELHERHRLWLASELASISRGIVDGVRDDDEPEGSEEITDLAPFEEDEPSQSKGSWRERAGDEGEES